MTESKSIRNTAMANKVPVLGEMMLPYPSFAPLLTGLSGTHRMTEPSSR